MTKAGEAGEGGEEGGRFPRCQQAGEAKVVGKAGVVERRPALSGKQR